MTKRQRQAEAESTVEEDITSAADVDSFASNETADAAKHQPETEGEPASDAADAPQNSTGGKVGEGVQATSERQQELEEKLNDTEARLLRTLADFDNFRRRTRQEHEDLQKFAAKKVLEGLLPVVDNFERALSALDGKDAPEDLKTGVEMVYRQLQNVLSQNGVAAMEAVGKAFDPQVHEAVMQESADGQEAGMVIQELQKGYMLHDKVLRPAMVKVSV